MKIDVRNSGLRTTLVRVATHAPRRHTTAAQIQICDGPPADRSGSGGLVLPPQGSPRLIDSDACLGEPSENVTNSSIAAHRDANGRRRPHFRATRCVSSYAIGQSIEMDVLAATISSMEWLSEARPLTHGTGRSDLRIRVPIEQRRLGGVRGTGDVLWGRSQSSSIGAIYAPGNSADGAKRRYTCGASYWDVSPSPASASRLGRVRLEFYTKRDTPLRSVQRAPASFSTRRCAPPWCTPKRPRQPMRTVRTKRRCRWAEIHLIDTLASCHSPRTELMIVRNGGQCASIR